LSVTEGGETETNASEATPGTKIIGKPFQKGRSGNPSGRPRIEPRVRRYARRYDRRMCKVLATIAEDKDASPSERRKAAMDLISVGSGRPALVQEIAGRNGEQLGPLVALNFGGPMNHGQMSPADAYKLMLSGAIDPDPDHPSFQRQREADPVAVVEKSEEKT
jgi:hypothetical protein